jgi:hypothetical protein
MDMSQIINLKEPLDTLYDLFQSFHIPLYSSEKGEAQAPTFHVETTLSILQSLLLRYDGVMKSLTMARETVSKLDTRQILNQQRISEWSSNTLKALQDTKSSLLQQHQTQHHLKSEKEILHHRLNQSEKDRLGYEQLVLSLVEKLNQAEETILVQQKQMKKWEAKVSSLKSSVDQMIKWKQHSLSNVRDRAYEYSERVRAKQKIQQGGKRTRSRSRTRSTSETPKTNSVSDTELIAQLLEATKISRKSSSKANTSYQPMYPAQSILLSKLKNIDGEINDLARDVLMY